MQYYNLQTCWAATCHVGFMVSLPCWLAGAAATVEALKVLLPPPPAAPRLTG